MISVINEWCNEHGISPFENEKDDDGDDNVPDLV